MTLRRNSHELGALFEKVSAAYREVEGDSRLSDEQREFLRHVYATPASGVRTCLDTPQIGTVLLSDNIDTLRVHINQHIEEHATLAQLDTVQTLMNAITALKTGKDEYMRKITTEVPSR